MNKLIKAVLKEIQLEFKKGKQRMCLDLGQYAAVNLA